MNAPTGLFLIVFLCSTAPLHAANLDAVVADCNGCHGDNGVSRWSDVPTIAGLAEFFHADALYVFRDNERPCAESEYRQGDTSRPATTMCAVAGELSDDDIDAIAAIYAELPYVSAEQEFDAALAAAGEAIHRRYCNRCHADAGMDPEDEAGMLGGQWMDYLRSTFAEYASGERDQPRKMKVKMDLLSEADTEALIHYYGSQE